MLSWRAIIIIKVILFSAHFSGLDAVFLNAVATSTVLLWHMCKLSKNHVILN